MKIFIVCKYTFAAVFLIIAVMITLFLGFGKTLAVYNSMGENFPVYCVENDKNQVALTFDTAWGNEDIDQVISKLAQYECRATFFVTGEWAEKFPEDIKKLHEAGHEIANHSYKHEHFNALSPEQMEESIRKGEEAIKKITGQERVLFRAPYGEYNKNLVKLCKNTDRYIIQWSKDSLDYEGLSQEKMGQRIFPKLKSGDILLFHTGTENTAAALPYILSRIKNKGFSFSRVGDMIYLDNFTIDHEGKQKPNN